MGRADRWLRAGTPTRATRAPVVGTTARPGPTTSISCRRRSCRSTKVPARPRSVGAYCRRLCGWLLAAFGLPFALAGVISLLAASSPGEVLGSLVFLVIGLGFVTFGLLSVFAPDRCGSESPDVRSSRARWPRSRMTDPRDGRHERDQASAGTSDLGDVSRIRFCTTLSATSKRTFSRSAMTAGLSTIRPSTWSSQ